MRLDFLGNELVVAVIGLISPVFDISLYLKGN